MGKGGNLTRLTPYPRARESQTSGLDACCSTNRRGADGTRTRTRSGDATRCDGECTATLTDPKNCLGCNYAVGGGVNCLLLTNSCNQGVHCDETFARGCVFDEYCEAQADAEGWAGWECSGPQMAVPEPGCDYCVLPTPTLGKLCLGDADDRFGETTCKSTCDLSQLWLSAFCSSDPVRQW